MTKLNDSMVKGRRLVLAVVSALFVLATGCSDSAQANAEKQGKADGQAQAKAADPREGAAKSAKEQGAAAKPAEEKKVAKTPAKPKKPAIKPETILVRVNGEDITWKELVRYTDMMAVMMKNRKKDCTPEDIRRFKAKFTQRFSNDLLQRKIMMTCLAPSNIVVSAGVRAQVERDFVRNYGKKGQKFEDLRTELKNVGYLHDINRALYSEMVVKQFLTTVCSNDYFVTDQELKQVRAGMERMNRIAAETNKLQVARAEMVLGKIRAGADFAKMANEYSQDDEKGMSPEELKKAAEEGTASEDQNGGDLGDCDESDFVNDKHIWMKLLRMKEGEVSELLEVEDGYAIYKVLEIKKAEDSNTGDKSLHLARIFFRRAFEFPEQTDDELRVDVEREKRQDLSNRVFLAFRKQSKIEYPDGHIQMR